jgi:hypothetical protein
MFRYHTIKSAPQQYPVGSADDSPTPCFPADIGLILTYIVSPCRPTTVGAPKEAHFRRP